MNQYIDRMPTDPTESEIADLCREVREIGFAMKERGKVRVHEPWPARRYPRGSVPAELAEVREADIEAAISEEI